MTRTVLVSRAHQLAAQLLVERGEVTGRAVPDAVRIIAEMDRSADQSEAGQAAAAVRGDAWRVFTQVARASEGLRDIATLPASFGSATKILPPGPNAPRLGRVVSVNWDGLLAAHLAETELGKTQSGSESEPEIYETQPAAPDDGHQSEIGDLVVRHIPGSGWVRRNKLIGY